MNGTLRSEQGRRLVAGGLIGLMALLWTITELLPARLSPGHSLYQVVWVRYGTHILVMLAALAPRRGLALLRTRRPALQIGRGLLMIVMPSSFILAIGRVDLDSVLALFWLTPLMLLAFAALIQQDGRHRLLWAAALGAALGAQLIMRPGWGVAAAAPYGLAMGLSFSLYVVLTRSLRHESTATNLLYSALSVFVPLTFFLPKFWTPLAPRDALLMAAVGLTGLGVLWAIDRATELAPVSLLAPLFALQLVLSEVLLPALGGPRPAWLALGGTLLILASALAAWLLPLDRPAADAPRAARAPIQPMEAP